MEYRNGQRGTRKVGRKGTKKAAVVGSDGEASWFLTWGRHAANIDETHPQAPQVTAKPSDPRSEETIFDTPMHILIQNCKL